MDIQKQLDQSMATIILKQDNVSFAIGSKKFLVADWTGHMLHSYLYEDLKVTAASENFPGSIGTIQIVVGDKNYYIHEDNKGNGKLFLGELQKKISIYGGCLCGSLSFIVEMKR
ncbi:hypothetical protein [Paenibacillus mucilaginosus]|uniref:hypothetical protein n=1 Tax=Paenibacillus mucilaginosus TaxID=61624 RepID=UPI00059FD7FF|nr:hypothetical protein [Paenibacillus mucilaginosus]MCG7217369.1 hypothetical protein [Paenibacillus mucilaginosus]WDM29062.1 hypothetical protein KCX80_07810 [Paenibacillus mucilaginosus]